MDFTYPYSLSECCRVDLILEHIEEQMNTVTRSPNGPAYMSMPFIKIWFDNVPALRKDMHEAAEAYRKCPDKERESSFALRQVLLRAYNLLERLLGHGFFDENWKIDKWFLEDQLRMHKSMLELEEERDVCLPDATDITNMTDILDREIKQKIVEFKKMQLETRKTLLITFAKTKCSASDLDLASSDPEDGSNYYYQFLHQEDFECEGSINDNAPEEESNMSINS